MVFFNLNKFVYNLFDKLFSLLMKIVFSAIKRCYDPYYLRKLKGLLTI